jgi:hypothetical protein
MNYSMPLPPPVKHFPCVFTTASDKLRRAKRARLTAYALIAYDLDRLDALAEFDAGDPSWDFARDPTWSTDS